MSSTDRQTNLLASEDWKRVYQTFKNAEFQSYDFDNLRRTMINYLRENYPEDFNDYIESSEYLALIDMIAFLGQNLAFRIDLNARENFLELAERRESILRLARLLSYNPKRNQSANGLLKIDSISTTESVRDSNNINLANVPVEWNDPTNPNWKEQFQKIINAALPQNGKVGNPEKNEIIDGVPTKKYRINGTRQQLPVYSYSKTVDGITLNFEIVSSDITQDSLGEESPLPGNALAFLYRDDGQGVASSNTGYFCHFRQGTLDFGNFNISNPSTNQSVSIDARNINNTDVWLYSVDSNGQEIKLWDKVDAVEGNNVIYNSLSKDKKDIYSVLTRADDRISLIFADGIFGNLPQGSFRSYYRTSANQRVVINPDSMKSITITLPYIAKSGSKENLSMTLGLKTVVDNASTSESNDSIRKNAPANYYTQNRMITGEDYQVAPLSVSQEIVKAKSINRTSSGISRYFDLVDATGKYSSTNLFGTDGIIFKEFFTPKTEFVFENLTDIEGEIINTVQPILKNNNLNNYYFDQFNRFSVKDLNNTWQSSSDDNEQFSGFFTDNNNNPLQVGEYTKSNMAFIKPNSLIKFEVTNADSSIKYVWTKVVRVSGNGAESLDNDVGPIVLSDSVPAGAKLIEIITQLPKRLTSDTESQVIKQIFEFRTFGLRYSRQYGEWRLITQNNINVTDDFSTGKTGDTSGENLDSSWLLLFNTDGASYTVTYRALRYVFESEKQISFYFDGDSKIFDTKTGRTVQDYIKILDINPDPSNSQPLGKNYTWNIVNDYKDSAGLVNPRRVELSFTDNDNNGTTDNPDIFDKIAGDHKVYFKKFTTNGNSIDFSLIDNAKKIKVSESRDKLGSLSKFDDNTLFYFQNEDSFERLDKSSMSFDSEQQYRLMSGRSNLKFQYFHAANENSRIDPSASNIVDSYLLTKNYDRLFRKWLRDEIENKPKTPSSDDLFVNFGKKLNSIKSVSDEIIYHPVKYKVLFGEKATPELQGRFKIVKNKDLVINDNEIKSKVINLIGQYFALDNWDFGDTFYFSELSAYVMFKTSPELSAFLVVPQQNNRSFGSLFEVKSESDEIFASGASVSDIDVIDEITASKIKAEGPITNDYNSSNLKPISQTLSIDQLNQRNFRNRGKN